MESKSQADLRKKGFLRREEVAVFCSVSLRQVDAWLAEGRLKYYRPGRRLVLIRVQDIEEFMENYKVAP
jgi:excisionase family DNA binding protein